MCYSIFDASTGNLVASFDEWEQARRAVSHAVEDDPQDLDRLILVVYDEAGNTKDSWSARELLTEAS